MALLRKMTCNLRQPVCLRHSLLLSRYVYMVVLEVIREVSYPHKSFSAKEPDISWLFCEK